MDPSLIEQLTPWLASGVIALVGILIGRRIEHRDAHTAWLREQRLRTYSEALAASRVFRVAAADIYHGLSVDDGRAVVAAGNEGGHTRAMVDLVGPAAVAEAAGELWDAHQRLLRLVLDIDGGLEPDRYSRVPLNETEQGGASVDAEQRFIEAAAAEVT